MQLYGPRGSELGTLGDQAKANSWYPRQETLDELGRKKRNGGDLCTNFWTAKTKKEDDELLGQVGSLLGVGVLHCFGYLMDLTAKAQRRFEGITGRVEVEVVMGIDWLTENH